MDVLYIFFLGCGVGIVSSTLGLGGGILIVPILPMILPLDQREVIATSVITVFLTNLRNIIQFAKSNLVRWQKGLTIGPLAAVFSYIAAYATSFVEEHNLVLILLGVLLSISFRLLFFSSRQLQVTFSPLQDLSINVLLALVAGCLSGFVGVGGGILISSILYSFHLVNNKEVAPTTNLTMVCTSLGAILGFALEGVDIANWRIGVGHLNYALLLFTGAAVSSYFGSKYQYLISRSLRKNMLLILLLIIITKMSIRLSLLY